MPLQEDTRNPLQVPAFTNQIARSREILWEASRGLWSRSTTALEMMEIKDGGSYEDEPSTGFDLPYQLRFAMLVSFSLTNQR